MSFSDHVLEDIGEALLPPNTPQVTKTWKWMATISCLAALGAFHVLWACGWLDKIGLGTGFAKADTVQEHVNAVMVPIQHDVSELKGTLTIISQQLRQQLTNSKASEIRAVNLRRCTAKNSDQKEALSQEIDVKESEFHDITSYWYPVPNCGDLK